MSETSEERVMALANSLSEVLAGSNSAEGKTALVVVTAASIIGLVHDERHWEDAAHWFAENVVEILRSKEHVDYLRSCIYPVTTIGHA